MVSQWPWGKNYANSSREGEGSGDESLEQFPVWSNCPAGKPNTNNSSNGRRTPAVCMFTWLAMLHNFLGYVGIFGKPETIVPLCCVCMTTWRIFALCNLVFAGLSHYSGFLCVRENLELKLF